MIASTFAPPVIVGRVREGADWHRPQHSHAIEEFVAVLKGCEKVAARGLTLIVPEGNVLFFPREILHEEWAHQCDCVESISISVVLRSPYERDAMPLVVCDRDNRMLQLATWFLAEFERRSLTGMNLPMSLLYAFYLEFRRLSGIPENPLVGTVRAYIRSHLCDRICLDDLARTAELSKSYFLSTYRKLTGLTPMAEARLIRLEEAKRLLVDTRLPLKAIASRLGFSDKQHLARLLKKRFGSGAKKMRGMLRLAENK